MTQSVSRPRYATNVDATTTGFTIGEVQRLSDQLLQLFVQEIITSQIHNFDFGRSAGSIHYLLQRLRWCEVRMVKVSLAPPTRLSALRDGVNLSEEFSARWPKGARALLYLPGRKSARRLRPVASHIPTRSFPGVSPGFLWSFSQRTICEERTVE